METESSLIAFGRRGTEQVVLKVVKRPGDEWRSGEVVDAFGGRGTVRSLEHDDGAVLLERIVPGTALIELTTAGDDDAATNVVADVIAQALTADSAPLGEAGRFLDRSFIRFVDDLAWWTEAAKVQRARKPPPY